MENNNSENTTSTALMKKRKLDDCKEVLEKGLSETLPTQKYPVGTTIFKHFIPEDPQNSTTWFEGRVTKYDGEYYLISYLDGDAEELTEMELDELAVPSTTLVDKYRTVPRVDPSLDDNDCCLWTCHGMHTKKSVPGIPQTAIEFFLFMSERQRIYERRKRGDKPPWSSNGLLQRYAWCNVYRELDAGTQYFYHHVRQQNVKLDDDKTFLRHVLFWSWVYRQVNRVETFQKIGFPNEANLQPFWNGMNKLIERGEKVFSGAHQTTNWNRLWEYLTGGLVHLDRVTARIQQAASVSETLQVLKTLKGVGDFFAWQIFCDLKMCGCITVMDNFCLLGPGAKEGLIHIYGAAAVRGKGVALNLAHELVTQQDVVYKRLGIQFPYWRDQKLTIREIEHALCEFAKFKNGRRRGFFTASRDVCALCDLCGQNACQCAKH